MKLLLKCFFSGCLTAIVCCLFWVILFCGLEYFGPVVGVGWRSLTATQQIIAKGTAIVAIVTLLFTFIFYGIESQK
jgi:hypothetical protein